MIVDLVPAIFIGGLYNTIEHAVEAATGPIGLLVIGVYSFLIAFVLPLPSEIVLAPWWAESFMPQLPHGLVLVLILLASGLGKAAGSLFAFHIGQEAKQSGPVIRFVRRSRFDIIAWSEKKTVQLAQRFGYIGLAIALTVPGFPDTLSIYAFSVLEEDYYRFAAATFVGSVGRLTVTVLGVLGVASVL